MTLINSSIGMELVVIIVCLLSKFLQVMEDNIAIILALLMNIYIGMAPVKPFALHLLPQD